MNWSLILILLSVLCFAAAIWLLFVREVVAPAASLLGLVAAYFSRLLPVTPNLVLTWLALTVIVMGISYMQPAAVMAQRRGVGYMLGGSLVGLAVGLLAVSSVGNITLLYACMIVGVLAGIFLGFLLFTRTPAGTEVNLASGRFFSYLAAKGFPLAITVIQPGILLMLKLVTTSF